MKATLKTRLTLLCLLLMLFLAPGLAADVYQVVRTTYYHGIPYQHARSLGPEAVPTLLELLGRDEEREHWANIVTVLGIVGDGRATEPLIDFLEHRFAGPLDGATYSALVAVPTSLGLLARDSNSRAFAYLRDATSLEFWQVKQLAWSLPSLEGQERDLLMVRRSITGLGFSGSEAALEHLRAMRASLDVLASTERGAQTRTLLQENVIEAIGIGERILSLGYERFFAAENGLGD